MWPEADDGCQMRRRCEELGEAQLPSTRLTQSSSWKIPLSSTDGKRKRHSKKKERERDLRIVFFFFFSPALFSGYQSLQGLSRATSVGGHPLKTMNVFL